ncbi:HAD family hydrolase [Fretibacter rubidus]|uniref:HAD family hydrolase n=1 Tax=Fretibacter rubidus TaxID=570162 RepID=UPI00352B4491
MSGSSGNLAIFDLDYTLTKRGTWGRFVLRCVRYRPHVWLPLLLSAGWAQFRYKRGAIPRVRVKQAMMRWAMPRWSREKLTQLAEDFAEAEVNSGLRPGAVAALQAHRDTGDTIMLASAAVDLIVAPIARRLGINHYVATDMAWEHDRLAPYFGSENCYGDEKLARVQSYLNENPELKRNNTVITMYSDSYSDLAIMQFADVGVSVNPDKRLLALSKTHNFKVVDWMSV